MAKHLTQDERYYICRRIASLDSIKAIANDLKVNKSTIYRELKRNRNDAGEYSGTIAQRKASLRRSIASRDKGFKAFTQKTTQYIYERLKSKWSPEQISGRMKLDINKSISHETIYSFIRNDKANGGTLYTLLSHRGKRYQYGRKSCLQIPNRVDISMRPAIVEMKTRIGDFEIDTMVSAQNTGYSCLLTMVDRRSKFVFIRKLSNKTAYEMQLAIEDIYQNTIIPFRTLTSDNGVEFANHQAISANTASEFYFARPYS
jgi:IS30 family transposase